MPVVTPRPTGHNAQRWSGIIGAMMVENKGFKGIHSVFPHEYIVDGSSSLSESVWSGWEGQPSRSS